MQRALATAERRESVAARWITSSRYDVLWYLAPCLLSYLLLWINLGLGVGYAVLWWTWTLVFDGPHVFGTINRTYLDREEWGTRSGLLLRSLLWFLPGPAIVAVCAVSANKSPFYAFLLFANCWAYWHVVRQHYGFLVLYQRKNGEPAGQQNRVDYWCFYLLMVLPFVSLFPRNEVARAQLIGVFGLSAQPSAVETAIQYVLYSLIWATLAVYVGKELLRVRAGKPWNVPKNLFLLACVPLHLVICLHPQIGPKLDPLMFTVLVTLFHNFQYTAIVWFYNKNRYHKEDSGSRYGVAARVARRFLTYYIIGLAFTLLLRYSHWICNGNTEGFFMLGPNQLSQTGLGGGLTVTELANAFWWGFAFNHYYLDQHIWRTSKDQKLNRELKLT